MGAVSLDRASAIGRRKALFVVLAMVLSIGLADYASGIRISLAAFYLVPILLAVPLVRVGRSGGRCACVRGSSPARGVGFGRTEGVAALGLVELRVEPP